MNDNQKRVAVDGSEYKLSLSKITGRKIADVHGYITTEFGDPVFKLCALVFDDGTELDCEGEHDLPYFVNRGDKSPPEMEPAALRKYDDAEDDRG